MRRENIENTENREIIQDTENSQNTDPAVCLVIGLGGTGAAALRAVQARLSDGKQQSGREPVRYLCIDAQRQPEPAAGEEFFALLRPGAPRAATRRRGRTMIQSCAGALRQKILDLCRRARSESGCETAEISVFILAGLSGITGGSCCADLCYIVRDVLRELDADSDTAVHGIFFLPDVAQSSPALFGHSDAVGRRFGQACAYAALQELDDLMRLPENGKKFSCRYDSFTLDTDRRPVDFFYLISAANAYGSISSNAYDTCMQTAAGYVAEYRRMPASMRERFDRARKPGISEQETGGERYISALGVSERTLPLRETVTFAASRFVLDFCGTLKEGREPGPSYVELHESAREMGLATEDVLKRVQDGCPAFALPDADLRTLRACGPVTEGEFPSVWSPDIEDWLEACARIRRENIRSLRKEYRSRIRKRAHDDLFSQKRGPYYVRDFLVRRGSDLREVIHEEREDIHDRFRMRRESLYGRHARGGLVTQLEKASADFVRSGFFGRTAKYERYKAAAQELLEVQNEMLLLRDVGKLLKDTDAFITGYAQKQIEPLVQIIEDLSATSARNLASLEKHKSDRPGFEKPLFRLEDLHPSLSDVTQNLDFTELSHEFLVFLQQTVQIHPKASGKSPEQRVEGWLGATFGSLCLEAADEYLIQMQEQTSRALERLCARTTLQLWCDAGQGKDAADPDAAAPDYTLLDVPGRPSSLYAMAQTVCAEGGPARMLYSGTEDEITVLHIRDKIALSDCRALPAMRRDYASYELSPEIRLDL